jgi:phage gpG-like protein
MAAPIGPVSSKGGVQIVLQPPLQFIMRQAGAFRLRLLDFGSLWDAFGEIMGRIEQSQFDSAGHGAWPSLAESTIRQKGHGDILVDSGELRRSLTDPGRAMQKSARTMSYGTDVDYARYHQEGTPKMPMRQVISDPFRVEDRRKLETAMVAWIDVAAAETFGRI